ncbi:Pyridoxamine 5'-phosphate oxidase [[Actinomadura] parvosata subsp. kistnae]|uniref:Pyridoxamine 5'-phosphate oxidase n=1 Tax=[Actinomadura] parvosata subsp. kistnae TaxID=1909395 RepID=A0A1V0A8F7_9ACTN|nr:pyridoxamine 5'-phosphate oxidase family protein [Nonomuraea sp. ATCC 55076]AQZ66496.1 pyridoxamine 5'-phosphate oxidase [Nonomuraea sp. ATCC 55076]SPL95439.1 Pyridoxamine 5'-phosphate oxidase [Actinomadura parvosata subsp. kistnae]
MEPTTELDARFSAENATATPWGEAREQLEGAETYWLSTVRTDGRPHVTPLMAVWQDDALHFCTGAEEQKARNLEANRNCVLTTGSSSLHHGLDLVVEGVAERVTDPGRLKRLADAWEAKYTAEWHFDVGDGVFVNGFGGEALVFAVAPAKVLGFRKGDYAQTRWRFR